MAIYVQMPQPNQHYATRRLVKRIMWLSSRGWDKGKIENDILKIYSIVFRK